LAALPAPRTGLPAFRPLRLVARALLAPTALGPRLSAALALRALGVGLHLRVGLLAFRGLPALGPGLLPLRHRGAILAAAPCASSDARTDGEPIGLAPWS